MNEVNIVIPIYNQKSLAEQCITSVLAADVDTKFKLTLINDASTDFGMKGMLDNFRADPRVHIVNNSSNMGFTKSANLGLSLSQDMHTLLLNSDTIVYDKWLDVMLNALTSSEKVASVNPLTNQNGSHISCYPRPAWSEDLDADLDDRELAQTAFVSCGSLTSMVHTCVGFCMLINKHCLEEIGNLDETNFPRGYGEESDFCYRASYMGWTHLVAGGAFVTHLHGKSFGSEKETLRDTMLPLFRSLHPSQPKSDQRFREIDPIRPLRRQLDIGRASRLIQENCISMSESSEKDGLYLRINSLEPFSVSFNDNSSKTGFPNVDAYVLPQDVIRLASDLQMMRVERVTASNHAEVLSDCKKVADLFSSGTNPICRVEDGALILRN